MKFIYKIFGKLSLIFYIFTTYQLWHLCQHGGIRSHMPALLIGAAGLIATFILWLIARSCYKKDNTNDTSKKKIFYIEVLIFITATLSFGGGIIYAAIPYQGALSWKIDEWMRKKEITLEHDNLFESGVEGILTDINEALDLPEELYIANKFQVSFDENGTIQNIYAFIYGKNEQGEKKTYLIDYDADNSEKMTVWVDGNANGEYGEEMRLSPMLCILNNAEWKDKVNAWAKEQEEKQIYELLYLGRRSFTTEEGLEYIVGDADGDGADTWMNNFKQLEGGGEIVGYEVSLHIPALNDVTPVRYIMEPEYISLAELNRENVEQQVEDAKKEKSWTFNQADGNMYFFLDDSKGWRLAVTDAAAGSRFYVLEVTENGGKVWLGINEDPFRGKIGVAEGLIFYDENFGFAGLANGSQSYSSIYITPDGGSTFEKIELPMDTVKELPEIAEELDFTVEDYDYLNMPEKVDGVLLITVTTDAGEKDGILFESKDNGATWVYKP